MKPIKAWSNSIEFISSRRWLFLLLIPVFYLALPVPKSNHHLLIVEPLAKFFPSEALPEVYRVDTEAKKIVASGIASCLVWSVFGLIEKSLELSAEDSQS
jgi:hypothetical protein